MNEGEFFVKLPQPINEERFGKESRLLSPSDFRPVFNKTQIRVSCCEFLMLAVDRSAVNSHPRLGIVAAKKHARRAVDRNAIKRNIRESFRLNKSGLPSFDIVVLVRTGADKLNSSVRRKKLDKLWDNLQAKTRLLKRNT